MGRSRRGGRKVQLRRLYAELVEHGEFDPRVFDRPLPVALTAPPLQPLPSPRDLFLPTTVPGPAYAQGSTTHGLSPRGYKKPTIIDDRMVAADTVIKATISIVEFD
ncbi:uncharacterized protein LOC118644797 [Monomorium pharaonis]|uniref:uncharacterized protein LOC118644797 n=1 Tax=Monomorium pharaonis TaxID=307658 RepID=UPI0017477F93|nr:uncharacterized protein LOC118644797 [Monomorium pharaonis]